MKNETTVPLFIPALSALLVHAEDAKASPLTPEEVLRIRDDAAVIMVASEHAAKMAESRGYADIDPENAWYDWQMLRREMGRKPDLDAGAKFAFVAKDDEAFQNTVVAARSTLDAFRQLLRSRANDGTAFPLVKVLLSEPDYRAYMWLVVKSSNDVGFVGEIFELPGEFTQYVVGQQLDIPDSDVQDWMLNDGGTLYGGYSLRYNRSKMDAAEQGDFDRHVGVTTYA